MLGRKKKKEEVKEEVVVVDKKEKLVGDIGQKLSANRPH